jgi:leucyl/phenylalanyl-tRNA--protein transferase
MGFRVKVLESSDPPDSFPDPATAGIALGQPDGLLAIGGDLSPERLLAAYSRGIFPWFNDDQPILWWSPDPRAVIFPPRLHMSRSLIRNIRRGGWQFSLNSSFSEVIQRCASERGAYGTWITPDMISAYCDLHTLGYAHSVESWFEGELAGGIYGVRLGSVFFGESMFSQRTNGSKVALSALVKLCRDEGITVIDCQFESAHLTTLGMEKIPRVDFLRMVADSVQQVAASVDWKLERRDAALTLP